MITSNFDKLDKVVILADSGDSLAARFHIFVVLGDVVDSLNLLKDCPHTALTNVSAKYHCIKEQFL